MLWIEETHEEAKFFATPPTGVLPGRYRKIASTEPLRDGCVRSRKRASPKWPRTSINGILTEQERKFRAAKKSSEVSVQLFCETMCILDLIDFYFEGIVLTRAWTSREHAQIQVLCEINDTDP